MAFAIAHEVDSVLVTAIYDGGPEILSAFTRGRSTGAVCGQFFVCSVSGLTSVCSV